MGTVLSLVKAWRMAASFSSGVSVDGMGGVVGAPVGVVDGVPVSVYGRGGLAGFGMSLWRSAGAMRGLSGAVI